MQCISIRLQLGIHNWDACQTGRSKMKEFLFHSSSGGTTSSLNSFDNFAYEISLPYWRNSQSIGNAQSLSRNQISWHIKSFITNGSASCCKIIFNDVWKIMSTKVLSIYRSLFSSRAANEIEVKSNSNFNLVKTKSSKKKKKCTRACTEITVWSLIFHRP